MAVISWKGVGGDWSNAADWTDGVLPGPADTASFTGTSAYTVTLYNAETVGGVVLNDAGALLYDAAALTLAGVFSLQAGTLALAYGSLNGGTLALLGGVLAAAGGVLNGVAVDGTLDLSAANASLFIENGLAMAGANGSGTGAITLTGNYAALNFLGTQMMANAVVTLGVTAGQNQGGAASLGVSHAYGANAATLTLASSVWVREGGTQGQIVVGGAGPGPGGDVVVNQGTITNSVQGGTLTVGGSGTFINQGVIGVSNGATLDFAAAGLVNTGTITVTNATLDFGGTFASSLLGSLGSLHLSQAQVEIGGNALNAGATLTVSSGSALGAISLAGSITGGVVLDNGGGLNFSPGTGVLDGVTYEGVLSLGAGNVLTLTDSTVLTTSHGGAGSATISGSGAALLLEGTTTLGAATISLGSNSGGAAILGTTDNWLSATATTATLGPSLVVQQSGKFAELDANATTPIAGYGLADTVVNQGNITTGFAGGTFTIGGYGTFINQGTLSASNQATLVLDTMHFSNTGVIALSGGATGVLGGPADVYGQVPAWSNSGVISLNNATLDLSGAMHTAQLGRITGSGTIALLGTLANGGATLTLGAGGTLPALSLSGTIQGGSVVDPNGLLSVGTAGGALLDGVTDTGVLNLSNAGAYLRVRDGLVLAGSANVTGAGGVLAFQGSQVFNNANVQLGAAGQAAVLDVLHDYGANGPSTLTLGPGLVITQAGALATLGAVTDVPGDEILNNGVIHAGVFGGTLALAGAGFANDGSVSVYNGDTLLLVGRQFSNAGTISVTNAYLSIADSLTVAQLGRLVLTNARIGVSGTLDNTGNTLGLGVGSAWGRLQLTGTINGGVIQDAGGGLGVAGQATLAGVTYAGVLDLSRPFQQVCIVNGITLTNFSGTQPGTMVITGAASRVLALGNETIDNATVLIGMGSPDYYGHVVPPAELAAGAGSTLTIGAHAHVQTAGIVGWLGDCTVGGWSDAVINDGTISAVTANGILTLGSTFFTNNGTIAINGGGNIMTAGVEFTNQGVMSVGVGSDLLLGLYNYFAAPNSGSTPFTNAGTLLLAGGVMQELNGNGLFPYVPIVNDNGALIQGAGNILAPVLNDGLIEAKAGYNLDLADAITGTGTIQIDPGCRVELSGQVAASQTVSFTATGETLRLDSALGFAAQVANMASGDMIDVAGTPVTSVALSNGTLVLGTGAGQFRLDSTAPLAGAFEVGTDTHNGSLVNYTAQSGGGGGGGGGTITTISVGQPKMLFWASPVGDIFQGTSANLQGASISNWTTTDSLDLTDYLGSKTSVSYAQANGQGIITVSDGTHHDSITLVGSYTASWFHVGLDHGGGALVTYSQS
jgi:hypothetical protein